jgi:hypothetical protein
VYAIYTCIYTRAHMYIHVHVVTSMYQRRLLVVVPEQEDKVTRNTRKQGNKNLGTQIDSCGWTLTSLLLCGPGPASKFASLASLASHLCSYAQPCADERTEPVSRLLLYTKYLHVGMCPLQCGLPSVMIKFFPGQPCPGSTNITAVTY